MAKGKPLYLIPVLSKALDILELLQAESRPMTLEAIHQRTRISKTTVYRVLKTFAHRGYLAQGTDGTYRHVMRRHKMRFGFAGQSSDMPFSNEVTRSLSDLRSRWAWIWLCSTTTTTVLLRYKTPRL